MERGEIKDAVALACRMLEHSGLIDYSGHVSARDPQEGFWIHPHSTPRNLVQAGDLVRVSIDGQVLEGDGRPPAETPIHAEIYRRREDVGAVIHMHPPITTALSIAGQPIVPVNMHGAFFAGGVPVLDDSRHVNTTQRGARLAQVLGDRRAVVMRGHGVVVVGDSVESVFAGAVYLEDNSRLLWRALAVGSVQPLSEEEARDGQNHLGAASLRKVWRYYRSYLERDQVPQAND